MNLSQNQAQTQEEAVAMNSPVSEYSKDMVLIHVVSETSSVVLFIMQ